MFWVQHHIPFAEIRTVRHQFLFSSHHPYRLRAMDSTGRYWSDKKGKCRLFFSFKVPESFVHIHRLPIHNAKYYILLQEISCKILHSDCSAHIKSGRLFYNLIRGSFFRLLRSVPRSGVIRFGYFRRIPTIAQSLTTNSTVVCRSLHQLSTFASSSSVVFNISSRIYACMQV